MILNWDSVVWAMIAGVCLAFGFIYLIIWSMQIGYRSSFAVIEKEVISSGVPHFLPAGEWSSLAFSVLAFSIAAMIIGEIRLLHAQTPSAFGEILRWIHIPFFTAMVSIMVFVRTYFRAGRLWIAYGAVILHLLGLILNFYFDPNINYLTITGLKQVEIFGGDVAVVAVGVRNPWLTIMELGSLLVMAFILDAVVTSWRRGGKIERHRALFVGSSLVLGAALIFVRAVLINAGIINAVYMFGVPLLFIFWAISFEFGADVIRSVRVTRQLQMSESSLRLSEQRMNLASDAAQLGMWEWNSAHDEIWATRQCRMLYGISPVERIDFKRVFDAMHPEDRDVWHQQVTQSLKSGGIYERTYRVVLPDGRVRWLDVRGCAETDTDKGIVIRGVTLDISERKQAELELEEQRNELAHLARVSMLSELSGSLAHELNQPLTAILSNAQAALRFMAGDAPKLDEVQEILHDIVSDDKRAGEIIQGLRLLLKKGERKKERLDMNDAVQHVLKMTRSDLLNASIVVTTKLAPALPMVIGDPIQLQQVLLNLVVNGCEAMKANSRTDRQLLVSTQLTADDYIKVCIEDQGHGIPTDDLELVFTPFFTTKNEGLGLGLAVCGQIIRAHGGRLWAENNPRKGASFFFTVQASSG